MSSPFHQPGRKAKEFVRKTPERNEDALSTAAQHLLARLPEGVKLTKLAALFPRIANRIAAQWTRPQLLKPYIAELLIDERGGRQGFPPDVASELLRLSLYYETAISPSEDQDPWATELL